MYYQYIENMYAQAEEDYERAMEKALDTCLGCDLFSLNDEGEGSIVGCRMNDDPINCGGPYHQPSYGLWKPFSKVD